MDYEWDARRADSSEVDRSETPPKWSDAYFERAALAQIEAGLRLDNWRPRFHRLERAPWYVRRPALLTCLMWSVGIVLAVVVFGLMSLVVAGPLLAALVTGAILLTPPAIAAVWLTLRHI